MRDRPEDMLLSHLREQQRDVVTESVHVVQSARQDGTVNLQVGTNESAIVDGVPALSSYAGRKAGDRVMVRKSRGSWLVIGRAGAEGGGAAVTTGVGKPDGAGWAKAPVWVRGNEVYVQTDDAPGGGDTTGGGAARVVIAPDDSGGWAEGHRNAGATPRQGHWSSYGPWSGGWFYGTKIADACSGRTVAGMTVNLARSGERHGYFSQQRPQIYTHAYLTAPGGTLALHQPMWASLTLGLGEDADMPLSGEQVTSLASGSQRGVAVYTSQSRTNYIIFTGGCGQLAITFSD